MKYLMQCWLVLFLFLLQPNSSPLKFNPEVHFQAQLIFEKGIQAYRKGECTASYQLIKLAYDVTENDFYKVVLRQIVYSESCRSSFIIEGD